jgi:diketogulonate reductase-like aldo/keto reductase
MAMTGRTILVHTTQVSSQGTQSTFTLYTGAQMPGVDLRTWQSGSGEVAAAVDAALRCGYHHIDT